MKKSVLLLIFLTGVFYGFSQTVYNIANYNGQTIDLSQSAQPCSAIFQSSSRCINYVCYMYSSCDGENYTITFYSGSPNKRVRVWFAGSASSVCNGMSALFSGDHLYAYDGPNTSSTLIHDVASTNYVSYPIISSGSYITFRWVSTTDLSFWDADVTCEDIPVAPAACNENEPASNDCIDAPKICNLNGYCGNTSDYYTSDLPGNMCETCNKFDGTMQNNSWLSFTADDVSASFEVSVKNCTQNIGIQLGVYSGTNCNNFQLISNPAYTDGTSLVTANRTFVIDLPYSGNLVKGQDYYIMVDGLGGDVCEYTIKALSGIFTANAGPDQTICNGQSANLTATGANSYTWSPANSLSASNIANPIASPSVTTTYTVTFTGGNEDCPQSITDEVVVNVLSYPVLSVNASPNSICEGASSNLSASGANTYVWSPVTGLNTTTGANPIASPTTTTTYTVTGSNNMNNVSCKSSQDIVVNVNPKPQVSINPVSTCNGIPVEVTAIASGTGTYDFEWSTGETGETITVNPNVSTSYTVTVTDIETGCQDVGVGVVTVVSEIVVSINPSTNLPVCQGTDLTLTASGTGITSYKWNTGEESSSIMITALTSTIYSVTASNDAGCQGATILEVTVNPKPDINIVSTNDNLCKGDSAIITANVNNGSGPYTFLWSNGMVENSFKHYNLNEGDESILNNYIVTITDNLNCPYTDTIKITDYPDLVDTTSVIPTQRSLVGYSPYVVEFKYQGGSDNITWYVENDSVNNRELTYTFYYDAGKAVNNVTNYEVRLKIANGECGFEEIFYKIEVRIPSINKVPNIITANNDSKNDEFSIKGEGIKTIETLIFDRWGNKIYNKTYNENRMEEGEKTYKIWDGRKDGGKECESGVYFYIIKAIGFDGKEIEPKEGKLKGSITLFR